VSHFAPTVTTTHLTPPHVLAALGGADSFDLDPCAAPLPRPWPTARRMISLPDNGLMVRWSGRVFLNPPYTGNEIGRWLARLAEHGEGVALINATTETEAFQRFVWERRAASCSSRAADLLRRQRATAEGQERAAQNNPAPSSFAPTARTISTGSPRAISTARSCRCASPASRWSRASIRHGRKRSATGCAASAARSASATPTAISPRHPKAARNPNWQAKVRQKLQQLGERVDRATYAPRQLALI
jgi:hypothetical protein